MEKDINREEYVKDFSQSTKPTEMQKHALATALDIRKFEIDLYWKRASYFWTFNALALTGYFLLKKISETDVFSETFVIACLGLVFSLAWFFVNRGSKIWQRNWEAQVDLLEDEVQGPLYKTTVGRYGYNALDLTAPYPFSVSQINQILNLYMTAIWLILISMTFSNASLSFHHIATIAVMVPLTGFAIYFLFSKGQTTPDEEEIAMKMRRRFYSGASKLK